MAGESSAEAARRAQRPAPAPARSVPADGEGATSLIALDDATAALVAVAATVAAADERSMRAVLRAAAGRAPDGEIEEVILQSYLFAGFPRALNAMRLWRGVTDVPAPAADHDPIAAAPPEDAAAAWERRGAATCATVYGPFYDRLRVNIAELHPALDAWMVSEGYGKVLGRPGLELARRELCVVGACVAAQQDRQLHSHLHGALHAGARPAAIRAALEVAIAASAGWLAADAPRRYRQLWQKVAGKAAATED